MSFTLIFGALAVTVRWPSAVKLLWTRSGWAFLGNVNLRIKWRSLKILRFF